MPGEQGVDPSIRRSRPKEGKGFIQTTNMKTKTNKKTQVELRGPSLKKIASRKQQTAIEHPANCFTGRERVKQKKRIFPPRMSKSTKRTTLCVFSPFTPWYDGCCCYTSRPPQDYVCGQIRQQTVDSLRMHSRMGLHCGVTGGG